MPTNTTTDQVGTLITTEFGSSPLSFPKGVANVAPYVSGVARTYAGVTEEPATLDGPFDEVAPVEEETSAPIGDTPWAKHTTSPSGEEILEELKNEVLPEETSVEDPLHSSPVEEPANVPVEEEVSVPDTSVQSDVQSEVKKIEVEAEKIAEDLKAEAERVIADVEAEAKKVGL